MWVSSPRKHQRLRRCGRRICEVGGDFHGQGSTPTALATVVESGSTISADAITSGNGGQVAVWSDNYTNFAGNISARGGATRGNGGYVETSGHVLDTFGTVDASAATARRASGSSTRRISPLSLPPEPMSPAPAPTPSPGKPTAAEQRHQFIPRPRHHRKRTQRRNVRHRRDHQHRLRRHRPDYRIQCHHHWYAYQWRDHDRKSNSFRI